MSLTVNRWIMQVVDILMIIAPKHGENTPLQNRARAEERARACERPSPSRGGDPLSPPSGTPPRPWTGLATPAGTAGPRRERLM